MCFTKKKICDIFFRNNITFAASLKPSIMDPPEIFFIAELAIFPKPWAADAPGMLFIIPDAASCAFIEKKYIYFRIILNYYIVIRSCKRKKYLICLSSCSRFDSSTLFDHCVFVN